MSHLPRVLPIAWDDDLPADADAVIVGGGFSGLVALVHLVTSRAGIRIVVVEKDPRRGPGVAYGACASQHLLNVPAARMGAFADDVGGFLAWLELNWPGMYAPSAFVPRRLYGAYLVELVKTRLRASDGSVRFVRDAITDLQVGDAHVEVVAASGGRCRARVALLAPGIPAARASWSHHAAAALVRDPWNPTAYDALDLQARVLIVGSGLTAIDAIVALRARGHVGPITAVSRNGRFPLPHAALVAPATIALGDLQGGPLALLRRVRRLVETAGQRGEPWQSVIDAIRPHIPAIWRAWSSRQRRQFLRHARPLWEIHRHRAPHAVLASLAAEDSFSLELVRGRVEEIRLTAPEQAEVAVAARGEVRAIAANRILNCIGPAMSVHATEDLLLKSLLANGIASADADGLGLCADADGRLLNADGAPQPRVLLVGALRRGDLWESTAVPELRVQAQRAARAALTQLHATSTAPPRLPRRDATANPPAALVPFLRRLQAHRAPISTNELGRELRRLDVAARDLDEVIAIDTGSYVRTLVLATPHVEVFVMAWLPGQRSPIHDHAGSACAVRVVSGLGHEQLYRAEPDGLVVPTSARRIGTGEVTVAFDRDIHSFGNAVAAPASPSATLVTLHVYSPPLAPTRKYAVAALVV